MDPTYRVAADIHVLPTHVPLPGMGVLPINAYVLTSAEPVLVDTGLGTDADAFLDAVGSVLDPADLRWIWLTHDDADHTGNIRRIFEVAPRARLVTNGLAALRMSTWWPVPIDRVYAVRPGDRVAVGDRTLRAVAPPLFDNPLSVGFLDEATGALFSVDSFGGVVPGVVEDAADVPAEALAGGMQAWAASDSPWAHLVDGDRFDAVLDGVRRLAPTHILSSHLPAAGGAHLGQFLDVLASVPGAEPAVSPDSEEFTQMLAAMAAAGGPPPEPVPAPVP